MKKKAEEREEGVPLHGIEEILFDELRVGDEIRGGNEWKVEVTKENIETIAKKIDARYSFIPGFRLHRDDT